MNNEYVSIVIPTYNRDYSLKKAIMSILNQTYQKFELIIVDDNSQDNTEAIVKTILDCRIKYIKLDKNSGANKARNIGVKNSKYNIVAFHDSDDEWHIDKLEKQLEYFQNGKFDIVSCKYNKYINNKFICILPNEDVDLSKNLLTKILYENFISTQTILGKKECFENEKFDESFPRFQDWDLILRLVKKYRVGFLNISLVDVYLQEDSITKNSETGVIALKKIYKKYSELILEDKKLNSYFNRHIYISSILNKKPEKQFIKDAFQLEKNLKNIVFYLISLFNLENCYFFYKKLKSGGFFQ
ncbi:glycosyltransferase family 2 protein [Cetobacterium somerae]|uniref:glycosyltransferase family 2 protein n=1 Tax=Cetobacterium somerae TaxID=188913 RepID=UPI0022598A55|nr:glycosyltransferase family 2 protein [Cetobacterium somerae]MCX3067002.1 glycosyltransferase family 2 protein [Cetobacterium somerae]